MTYPRRRLPSRLFPHLLRSCREVPQPFRYPSSREMGSMELLDGWPGSLALLRTWGAPRLAVFETWVSTHTECIAITANLILVSTHALPQGLKPLSKLG